MRWKFGSESDKSYKEHRARMLRRIDEWWRAFEKGRGKIEASFEKGDFSAWDLPGWMERHLQAIDERLMWDFGPGLEGGHRLVITPESARHLRPLVETMIDRAPWIDGWKFHPYRPAIGLDEGRAMLKGRGLAPVNTTKVRVSPGEHHLVDLAFLSPDYTGPDDREAMQSVFIASEMILGEELLDTWIGAISVDEETSPSENAQALDRMKEAVDGEIASIRNRLPDRPAWKLPHDTKWTSWELEPEKADDYSRQEDLFVGRSMYPEMWTAARSDCIFSSRRFSRFGELFCYVKTDGSSDLSKEKFADKAAIEDALDRALKDADAGAVIGGGTGLRYSYVDLALTDPEKGLQQVVEALRKGNIVKRTWILFHDDIYANEWVGAWDDSPPPPGQ